MSRVLDLPAAIAWREQLRRDGRRMVFTNGCFDLLHPGHLDLLGRARALGDALLVAINSDASVRRNKGPARPILPGSERAELLAALRSVDAVTVFEEDTPARVIEALLPDVLVKGADWGEDRIVGRDTVEAAGGSVVRLELLPGLSTSAIVTAVKQGQGPLGRR